ncbi:DNA-binding XRE family transcriptional regulator [Virgibacillus natechei]|uniref:DNA-binding XRE family transcriptional regulator n=1 Tax=Virgibacillus natechei TaxID=1216297 RepID=A0ABS4IL04_9BACI|nr:helix-turn-helix domain-containing protein [Virgibacillus natechei]MBP1971638.1 DNA-binding XRE family transcriptional regulator [Virgibacillus natechei]UZD13036.1 helix-turn-helix domain-containing protein [Virgibacillus natechei]
MNNKLRLIRKERGMSISELSRRTNISRQSITKIELHDSEPSGITMLEIARSLDKDPRDIFFTNVVIQDLQNEKQII